MEPDEAHLEGALPFHLQHAFGPVIDVNTSTASK